MLGWRIFISALVIPLLGLVFYFDHHAGVLAPYLFVVTLFLAVRGSWEIVSLLKTRQFEPRFPMVCACSCAIVAASWWEPFSVSSSSVETPIGLSSLGPIMMTFTLCVLILFFSAAVRFREPGKNMETLSAELLAITYVGLLLSMTAQLRWVAGADAGYLILGSLIIATKGGDVGAYFVGRFLGNKKFSPHLSPKKTWAGVRGALVVSAILSAIWLYFMPSVFHKGWEPCPLAWSLLYGLIIGATGIIGDLCESLIKRDVGKKDSARLLPGFGGLLDILDSVIFTGPIAYFLWIVFPISSWTS